MKKNFCSLLLLILSYCAVASAQSQFQPPTNKMLVVSGGGARGAWGVGVASELYKKYGGYKAVFGTSTGSLMAPFILLQKFDTLEKAYSSVTQKDIFNQSPFKVTYNEQTGEVKTKLRTFKIIRRMLFGKKTFGETENLLKLIKRQITPAMFAELIKHAKEDKMVVAVSVTNTRTGRVSLMSDSLYENTPAHYDSLCRWIWASANQPLFMSYTQMGDSFYVDGGLREVIPVEKAVRYAVAKELDTIDIIINNSKIPESRNWDINNGGIMNGLKRVMGIYNMSTVQYNENHAHLMNLYYNLAETLPPDLTTAAIKRKIVMRFYCMPDDLALKYADELGFVQKPMQNLIAEGKKFAQAGTQCFEFKFDNLSARKFKSLREN